MDDDELKFQQMQDEMSRFEAEIAEERPMRAVIGSATYSAVQQRLQRGGSPGYGSVPPPPMPPSLLLPSQLQRSRLQPPPSFSQFSPVTSLSTSYDSPPSPTAPQPIVLSGAPQLYKKPAKDEYVEIPYPSNINHQLLPLVTPAAPKPLVELTTPHIPTPSSGHKSSKKEKKNRKIIRTAGGSTWEDLSLLEWPEDDFRLFCGDLGNDVTDELLSRTFSKYSSFSKAKVIRDKRTNKSKGFGFISFREPADFIKAMKEMNGRYVGSRPIKLRKSTWRARSLDTVRKKEKEKAALISLLTSGGPGKS